MCYQVEVSCVRLITCPEESYWVWCVQWVWLWSPVRGGHEPEMGWSSTYTHKKKTPNWAEGQHDINIQLSFTASNMATVDYSVLSLMMNKNISTIVYSVDCKHFLFIWPLCPNGFSLMVQQCPAPKMKNWSSSSSFPLKYETVSKLWKFPFVFEVERMKCKNTDHPYICQGLVYKSCKPNLMDAETAISMHILHRQY